MQAPAKASAAATVFMCSGISGRGRRTYLPAFEGLAASRILVWMSIIRSNSSAVDILFRVSWRRRAGDLFLSGFDFGRSGMHKRNFPT